MLSRQIGSHPPPNASHILIASQLGWSWGWATSICGYVCCRRPPQIDTDAATAVDVAPLHPAAQPRVILLNAAIVVVISFSAAEVCEWAVSDSTASSCPRDMDQDQTNIYIISTDGCPTPPDLIRPPPIQTGVCWRWIFVLFRQWMSIKINP